MIFMNATRLPLILRVGDDLLQNVDEIISDHNLSFPHKLVISTPEVYELYEDELSKVSRDKFLITSNQISERERLVGHLEDCLPGTLLLAFGGGQVIDIVKYGATRVGMNYLSLPTALSNDGIYSPIAVVLDGKKRRRMGANIPLGIVVDLGIVTKAPVETLRAGVGDVLSNHTALLDWQLARDKTGELINDFAYTLSLMSTNMVRQLKPSDLGTSEFCAQLAYSLVMSGLAMEICGDSRPCSGAEHMISHAIEECYPERVTYHGIQVAAAMVPMLRLHGEDPGEMVAFMEGIGMPVGLKGLGFEADEIVGIMRCAQNIRKRFTIINTVTIDRQLVDKIDTL